MTVQRFLRCALELVFAAGALAFSATPARAQSQADFFDDTALQEVRLAISDRDWQALKANFMLNTYYAADLTWRGMTVRNVGIRSRGGGTRSGTKPGLRIDINRYLSNQEFVGLKAFELKNMDTDPSLLRETLAMKVFAQMGITAPREAHARLYINNEYVGVYVIVESVDRTFVTQNFGALEGQVENGGFLFEYQWVVPYEFEYLGSDLKAYAPLFQPQTRDTAAIVDIYGPLEELIRTLNESSDEDFEAAVSKYLDLPELMKYLAVELFTVEWDGLAGNWAANNFYLYRFRQTGRSQLIPKDRDHAFIWDGVDAADFIDAPIMLRLDTSVLARRALNVPDLRSTFLDTLSRAASVATAPAANDPRGWLEREIDREASQIASSVAADPVFPFTADDFQNEVNFLLRFARTRPAVVACQVAQQYSPSDQSCSIAADSGQ